MSTRDENSTSETLERDGLTVTIIETTTLGGRSYLVDDGRAALVVDPQRDIDRVEQVLEQRGVDLVAVAETHAHNDYVSRRRVGGGSRRRRPQGPAPVNLSPVERLPRLAEAVGDPAHAGRRFRRAGGSRPA